MANRAEIENSLRQLKAWKEAGLIDGDTQMKQARELLNASSLPQWSKDAGAENPHGDKYAGRDISECPFLRGEGPAVTSQVAQNATTGWWPNQLNLKVLHASPALGGHAGDPTGKDFDYAEAFSKLDLGAVKADLTALMTNSQEWWPADYGHYGPFMVRMAWHAAGTYRTYDGRGGANTGNQRFAPLNSWPDNANLDKARRLLWPIKQRYGNSISWADLLILTGNVAMESMGFNTFGFAGGRADIWQPEDDIYWGPESTWLADERHHGQDQAIADPLGAVQMGLIYVNPTGPGGNPDPLLSAKDIRETFARMAMNDYETVALVAGGHTFGKCHGAGDADKHVGPEPEGATIEQMGFGWKNSLGDGKGVNTITSGLEGAWTAKPATWDHGYFKNLFAYEWELYTGPGGAPQWRPKDGAAAGTVPDAHDPDKKHAPMMLTSDLALRMDPAYNKISKHFLENPEEFADAFGKAWYKLCHRDMGPIARCLGPEVPEAQIWQDPVAPGAPIADGDVAALKAKIMGCGVSGADLVRTAWGSAVTYRHTDHRGGANGARIALAPQKDWAVNKGSAAVLAKLASVKPDGVSLADMIVLGGCAAVEAAAKKAGIEVSVPFTSGRGDATAEQTDAASFAVLEPRSDGFRNYLAAGQRRSAEELLVDRAHLLKLTAPEMSVLVAGMRAMDANAGGSQHGVFTKTPGALDNSFFVNLLDMSVSWSHAGNGVFEGRRGAEVVWTGTRVDLAFGSNSQLRALAEYYAQDDNKGAFVNDFAAAWAKVMSLDRFDVARAALEAK